MERSIDGNPGEARPTDPSPRSNDDLGDDVEPSTSLEANGGSTVDEETDDDSINNGVIKCRRTINYPSGGVYEGELKNGKRHGKGVYRDALAVYDGDWKDNNAHGTGTCTWAKGNAYEGMWKYGKKHGWGTATYACGDVYEGQWVKGEKHGRGTFKWENGDIYEGDWSEGRRTQGKMRWANGDILDFSDASNGGSDNERQPRSLRSQQRRLQNTAAKKTCEHCGVDDYQYKLRICSGCGLALYCSTACQKATRGSHRRICGMIADLPPRDSDRLVLELDREKMTDLNAGLHYGKKYMGNLKHLAIALRGMSTGDAAKLSGKRLSSLLTSKKGALESVFWLSNEYVTVPKVPPNGDVVWRELHGLKQLRLQYMRCSEVQSICDIIRQQKNTLVVLGLPYLDMDWSKAKCRRTFAQAVSSCKHLVKLELQGSVLMDSDLKIMLNGLPNLRVLNLARYMQWRHQFTDNTCGLIARKCPGLQELNLTSHDLISVRGIRKIFGGCVHLRRFSTTALKLRCEDVRNLLDIAPQLLCISLGGGFDASSDEEISGVIARTNGRTLIRLFDRDILLDRALLSAESMDKYQRLEDVLDARRSKREDPNVVNEWEDLW